MTLFDLSQREAEFESWSKYSSTVQQQTPGYFAFVQVFLYIWYHISLLNNFSLEAHLEKGISTKSWEQIFS